MRTRIVIDLSDGERRALRRHTGEAGLATRAEVTRWVEMLVRATLDDICYEAAKEVPPRKGRCCPHCQYRAATDPCPLHPGEYVCSLCLERMEADAPPEPEKEPVR